MECEKNPVTNSSQARSSIRRRNDSPPRSSRWFFTAGIHLSNPGQDLQFGFTDVAPTGRVYIVDARIRSTIPTLANPDRSDSAKVIKIAAIITPPLC